MQKDSKLFDDFSKMASGAAGLVMDMRREVESMVHSQMEKLLTRMNLVKREEFEVVRDMAQKAREQQDALGARVAELEKRLTSQKAAK